MTPGYQCSSLDEPLRRLHFFGTMIISDTRRFVFVHVFKVGGTSMRAVLEPHATIPVYGLAGRPELGVQAEPALHKHATALELRNCADPRLWKQYFKFAFVRNPWDWQVSLYHYMISDPFNPHYEEVRSWGSFDAYIRWRCAHAPAPQSAFVCDESGKLIVDFVGRFERIHEDFGAISERLGLGRVDLPHLKKVDHPPYQELYTAETRSLVARAFEQDIRMFTYDFSR
jgi:hypothetical protein